MSTPYVYNTDRKDSYDYFEDDWTKRLKNALGNIYPKATVLTYLDKMTTISPLDLDVHESVRVFPFYGGIDMIIRKERGILVANSEPPDQETMLEFSHQRTPLTSGKGSSTIPKKIGELLAGLHFLLIATVIRAQKEEDSYFVEGTLVDKLIGTIQCRLTGAFGRNICFEEITYNKNNLSPETLCPVLEAMF